MKTEIKKPSYEVLCEAAELIKKGEVVAIPTETVYGLAADAGNPQAVEPLHKGVRLGQKFQQGCREHIPRRSHRAVQIQCFHGFIPLSECSCD